MWGAVSTNLAYVMGDAAHHNIDSTTVRAHVSAADAKKRAADRLLADRGPGEPVSFTASPMSGGRPIAFHLTSDEAADSRSYVMLMALPVGRLKALLADKGYDADAIRADLAGRRVTAVILGRSNRVPPIQ